MGGGGREGGRGEREPLSPMGRSSADDSCCGTEYDLCDITEKLHLSSKETVPQETLFHK